MLSRLQLLHASSTVGNLVHADRGADPVQNESFAWIFDDDVSRHRLLGDELEYAVLKVLVSDRIVIQKRGVRIRGSCVLHHRESQRRNGQDAEPRRIGAAANAAEGGIDCQSTAVCQPAGSERKASTGDRNHGRTRRAVGIGGELAQLDASSAGSVEDGVVEKSNPDLRIRSRFDYVMSTDKVADTDLSCDAAPARKGDVAQRTLNDADDLER
ncbi:hypothetical protein [Bradyrhizobium sp. 142]|uniref:hypothetical protein n=1 Tax=Bradyrhizobium sp. 142 TaxID=2782618 RepID=UPI001FFBCCEC|nr:hypothetical protein [Bradyrhizobium sp. 142]